MTTRQLIRPRPVIGDRTGDDAKNHAEDDRQHPDKGSRVGWPSVQVLGIGGHARVSVGTIPREGAVYSDGSSRIAEYRPTMREVKISLTGWTLADAMGELRKWLDHHNCVPVNFDIERGNRRVLVVRILFADDTMADMFERDFGGR